MIASPETLRRAGDILRDLEKLHDELSSLFNGKAITGEPKRRGRPSGRGKSER